MQTARVSELRRYEEYKTKPHIFYEAGEWYTRAPYRTGGRYHGTSPAKSYQHYELVAGWRLARDC